MNPHSLSSLFWQFIWILACPEKAKRTKSVTIVRQTIPPLSTPRHEHPHPRPRPRRRRRHPQHQKTTHTRQGKKERKNPDRICFSPWKILHSFQLMLFLHSIHLEKLSTSRRIIRYTFKTFKWLIEEWVSSHRILWMKNPILLFGSGARMRAQLALLSPIINSKVVEGRRIEFMLWISPQRKKTREGGWGWVGGSGPRKEKET